MKQRAIQDLIDKYKLVVTCERLVNRPVRMRSNIQGEPLARFCTEFLDTIDRDTLGQLLVWLMSDNIAELTGPAVSLFKGDAARFCNLFGTCMVEAILTVVHDDYINYVEPEEVVNDYAPDDFKSVLIAEYGENVSFPGVVK